MYQKIKSHDTLHTFTYVQFCRCEIKNVKIMCYTAYRSHSESGRTTSEVYKLMSKQVTVLSFFTFRFLRFYRFLKFSVSMPALCASIQLN
jgi:hypothetical protein